MSNSSFFSGTGITATQSTAIETSVDAAGTSATDAAASALLASQKAALATDKSNTAAGFANASEVSKDASVVAKNSAATSATNAASSASTANTTKNDVTALKNATQVLHDATEVFKNTANTKANEASASAAVASTKEGLATTAASATSGSASAAATSAAASNQAKIAALAAQADAEDAEAVAIANAALALSRQQLASTAASQALGYRNEAASASSANSAATASANAAAASATTALAAKNAALLITGNYLGAHSSAPTTATGGGSLVIGMLYFNTTTNVMMVYGSGGWGAAGSSVNGTSERKTYIATANQTTFAATYDSGFVDIWQNGAKLYVTDFTATNGSSIVLASGATVGDTIEIVAFGTFSVANQTFAGTTTVSNLVVTGSTNLGSTNLTTTGKMLYSNLYSAVSDLPSASTYHGMFAHVHATGLAYYAHAGAWVALSRASDVPTNAAIRSAVEAASDSNVFTDADHTKLNAIEASATADQTKSDIEGLGIDLPAANLTGTIAAARLSTATTQAESDDSTKIATTAYVVDKITTLIGGAPSTLNDLNELAAAINDDASYNSTLTTALATKMPKAGGAFTGAVTTNSTIDGRDVAADGVLATNALPKSGGTMTGDLTTTGLTVTGDDIILDSSSQAFLKLDKGASSNFSLTRHYTAGTENWRTGTYDDGTSYVIGTPSAKKLSITTGGNVGIGTTSPAHKLDVNGSLSSNGNENVMRIAGADASNAGGVNINTVFGDSAASRVTTFFSIDGQNQASPLAFGTGTTEHMRISSGNLLVNGTVSNPAYSNTANQISLRGSVGTIEASRDGGAPLELNRKSSFGAVAQFRKDGSVVGSIGAPYTNELSVSASGTNSAGILLSNANQVRPMKNGSTSSSTQDLGASNGLWKDLYLSGGVFLGGTGTANKLDDYDESTFTARLRGGSANGSTITTTAKCVKVGSLVSYHFGFENVDTTNYSGQIQVDGFPYANHGSRVIGNLMLYLGATWSSNQYPNSLMEPGATKITGMSQVSQGPWVGINHNPRNTVYMFFSGSYTTTA